MAAAGGLRLLAVLAALAASAHALPCPVVVCPEHQQGAPPAQWQVLLLPPHGVIALVPGHVRLCPPHQPAAGTPKVAAQAATTTVSGELGTALTAWLASLPPWDSLVSSLLSAPIGPCGSGQVTGDGKQCAEATPSPAGTSALAA